MLNLARRARPRLERGHDVLVVLDVRDADAHHARQRVHHYLIVQRVRLVLQPSTVACTPLTHRSARATCAAAKHSWLSSHARQRDHHYLIDQCMPPMPPPGSVSFLAAPPACAPLARRSAHASQQAVPTRGSKATSLPTPTDTMPRNQSPAHVHHLAHAGRVAAAAHPLGGCPQ